MRAQHLVAVGVFARASSLAHLDLDAPGVSSAAKWGAWKQQFAQHGADEAAGFAKFAATEARINSQSA